jgi:beta-glucosidase
MKNSILISSFLLLISLFDSQAAKAINNKADDIDKAVYKDPTQPIDARVADLISRMTLEEKISQMLSSSPAIERLGIPEYNWWSECLHGVARSGKATVFPQAIGLAATFDEDLMFRVATAISDEARALYRAASAKGYRTRYMGLTFWTPNINIFRDPRWGRGQETYGEDPYLTSVMGTAFVKGLQGDNPVYLKVAACAKHYAVHSGPESLRHSFDAEVSLKDLYETYLPAFKALVEAGVQGVMCAYNRTDGEPCCGSKKLLTTILRDQWGFKGYIVSDCGALRDFHSGHKITSSSVESAALAINSGVNLNCGSVFSELTEAVKQGLVKEETIDKSLAVLLRIRFKLGLFDPPELNPYTSISTDVIRCNKHRALAREAAVKSIVLLKNSNNVLPLKKDIRRLFVTGPFATSAEVLLGNYYGVSDELVTILEGITGKIEPGSSIEYRQGFLMDRDNAGSDYSTARKGKDCDASIVVMGISGLIEGEQGMAIASPAEGDRNDIGLPANQIDFLKEMRASSDKPIIVILTGGSPLAIPQVQELADAILFVWYPGEQGGRAVADVLFGDASPSGRLPVTFPKSVEQLPPFEDYSMVGRTYRYMTEEPLYPFGFGLSYARFEYSDLLLDKAKIKKGDSVRATVTVKNVSDRVSDEVVQLYLTDIEASTRTPLYALKGFKRVSLESGQSKTVRFTVTPEMMTLIDDQGEGVLEAGRFRVTVGGCSPGKRGIVLGAPKPTEAVFTLE